MNPKRIILPCGPMPYLTNVSFSNIDDGFKKTLSPGKRKKLDKLEIAQNEYYNRNKDSRKIGEDNVW